MRGSAVDIAPVKPRKKTSKHHRLEKVRTPGLGKQITWRCANKGCDFKDEGGALIVCGCPKQVPKKVW